MSRMSKKYAKINRTDTLNTDEYGVPIGCPIPTVAPPKSDIPWGIIIMFLVLTIIGALH